MRVWLVSYVGWLPTAQLFPSAQRVTLARNALMIAAHVVWGAALESYDRMFRDILSRKERLI